VPPDVLVRKLTFLRQLLRDLAQFENVPLVEMKSQHYTVERLFELLVAVTTDILFHELKRLGFSPESYRDAFQIAAEQNLLPLDLSTRLQQAAGMRNIIVHLYETIDYTILHSSIEPALRDFNQFLQLYEKRLLE